MAYINGISPSLEDAFDKLNRLEDSTFQDILIALNEAEATIHPGRLAKQILPKLQNINLTELQDIFRGIALFQRLKKDKDFKYEEIVDEVIDLIAKGETEKIKFSNTKQSNLFKERMLALLKNEILALSQKVSEIYYSHQNLFSSGEITVDIRPIYGSNESKYTVLSAVLHLEFTCDGESRNVYLGIDRDDLKMLKRIIEEAEQKIKIMESMIEKMDMNELRIDKEQNK